MLSRLVINALFRHNNTRKFPSTLERTRVLCTMSVGGGIPLMEVVKRLEKFAPLWLAECWDNVGLLIEPSEPSHVDLVLLTNDLTEDVMQEAVDKKVGLIVSYHPPIFKAIKNITNANWKTRIVSKCLRHNIGVFSPHTCYDNIPDGVNDWLASAFDFIIKKPIALSNAPAASHCPCDLQLEECGAGRLLNLREPITVGAAALKVKELVGAKFVHVALARGAAQDSMVETVGLCAGSGGSLLSGVKADLLLTGEMSHHEVLDANHRGASVILTWHSTSERGFLKPLAQQLNKLFTGHVKVIISEMDAEPIVTI